MKKFNSALPHEVPRVPEDPSGITLVHWPRRQIEKGILPVWASRYERPVAWSRKINWPNLQKIRKWSDEDDLWNAWTDECLQRKYLCWNRKFKKILVFYFWKVLWHTYVTSLYKEHVAPFNPSNFTTAINSNNLLLVLRIDSYEIGRLNTQINHMVLILHQPPFISDTSDNPYRMVHLA